MGQEHGEPPEPRELPDTGSFYEFLSAYRDQLEDPGFASGLPDEGGATGDTASQLARLHSLAAERFEEQAVRHAAKAEWVDAYEQGAYGEPLMNGVMLTVLMTTTLGFSTLVLLRMRGLGGVLFGAVLFVVTLGLNAIFVKMWRRPPYSYEAEYRRPSDDAANLARDRAQQARTASFAGDVAVQNPPSAER
jgi:hypothetical protein